ncbi:MAG TPA: aminoacyl-tRNA hydrolase, partial [Bacteroidia bacterium]|nr:aminoacyl-tRNA hydrolase [Bacteroidia bacterium]
MDDIRNIDFLPELKFTASRSGGKGGQNVNKVSTKVELHFDYLNSVLLNDEQKQLVAAKLASF